MDCVLHTRIVANSRLQALFLSDLSIFQLGTQTANVEQSSHLVKLTIYNYVIVLVKLDLFFIKVFTDTVIS